MRGTEAGAFRVMSVAQDLQGGKPDWVICGCPLEVPPQQLFQTVKMLGSHAQVASALLLLTMGIALNEARDDYVLLGMYAVGLLHGALLFALSRGGESRRMCTLQPKAAATPTPAPPAKSPVSVRPAAQLTMTVDKFESLRAGRKEPTAVLTPTSSRRKSLRTPNNVPRLGEWSE